MKKQPDLSSLPKEELQKKLKNGKVAAYTLLGIIIFQFVIGVYLTMKDGFNVFITLPFAFLPLVVIMLNENKKISTELEKRKTN